MRFFGSFGVPWAAKGEKGGFQKVPKNGKSGVAHPFAENEKSLFSLSKTIENASGGDPGTAQRPKKGYFEKRVFSDNLARNAFFMFFCHVFFVTKKRSKKRPKVNKEAGNKGKWCLSEFFVLF